MDCIKFERPAQDIEILQWNYITLLEHFLNGTDRLRFAPAGRSGAAEFPPHPPSVMPSLGRTEMLKNLTDRGLVAVTVRLGRTTWNASLMPMGDGTQFIPLPAKVRKSEHVEIGNCIKLSFVLRKR